MKLTDRSLSPSGFSTNQTYIHIVDTNNPTQDPAGSSFKSTIDGAISGSPYTVMVSGTGINSTIRRSVGNTASGCYSAALGGQCNVATGRHSIIAGGYCNKGYGHYSAIVGGSYNTVSGSRSTIAGGDGNGVFGNCSFIGGGGLNTLSGNTSTIAGGDGNKLLGDFSFIGSGQYNSGTTYHSSVVGGYCNLSSGACSFIGGGGYNTVSGCYSTIGGGRQNTASGGYSTIGGGGGNTASGCYSTIGGGSYNTSSGRCSTIGGGYHNTSSGCYSTIGGGYHNTSSGCYSTIGGGRCNTVSSSSSTIAGGISNNVSGGSSTIGGGCCNTVSGCFSSIIGGQSNNDGGFNNIHIIGSNITGTTSDTTFVNNLRSLGSVSATTYQNLNNQIGLSGLSGVSITSVSDGDMLVYSGSSWMNKTQEFISRQNQRVVYTDFMVPSTSAAVQFPYVFTLINSGSVNSSLLKNGINPGVLRFRSSATTNSGVYLLPLGNALTTGTNYISPNTQVDYIFRTPATIVGTGINLRFGLGQSASSTTDLDNGYYIEMIENTLYGKTADGSIRSQTSTSFTTAINTWYHGRVKYISTSLVEYSLYSMDGTLLWNSTLTTNITTNPLNPLIIAISTNASAIDLVINDYFSTTYPVSNRGALN